MGLHECHVRHEILSPKVKRVYFALGRLAGCKFWTLTGAFKPQAAFTVATSEEMHVNEVISHV